MTKLFSLESDSSDKPELLIDKVIRQADKNKEGMQVTADLIKQRQAVRQEIDQELKKGEDNPPKEEDDPEDSGDTEKTEEEEAKDNEEDSGKEQDKKEDPEKEEEESQQKEEEEEEDSTEAAQDEKGLEDLVGSDTDSSSKNTKEKRVDKDKEDTKAATESYRAKSFQQTVLFGGIVPKHNRYIAALEEYNLTPSSSAPTKQTVAYVKEEVLESLKKMTVLANRYTAKNQRQVESGHRAMLNISENLTVYQATREANKLHLTLKIVSDDEVLKQIANPNTTDLKETLGVMSRYLESNTALVIKTLQNELSELPSALIGSGYREVNGVYVYSKVLPGFIVPQVACSHYEDYLKTKYSDFQAYSQKSYKTQELYNLSGISLDKDTELVTVLEKMSSIVVQTGMMLDNLMDISNQYVELVEKVKATCFDIEQDKVKQLADLDIDSRLKDFIRFKVASELYNSAIDTSVGYLTSVMSALSVLVEMDE